MQIESSNNSKEKDFSHSLKVEKENVSCKDGFCTLPIQNETPIIQETQSNIFDPI